MSYTGRCYCGDLEYEFDEPIHSQLLCHCRECRYFSGGGANSSVIISEKSFHVCVISAVTAELTFAQKALRVQEC